MFAREQRVSSTKDIIATLRQGQRVSGGPLSCSFRSTPGKLSRVAVIVDKKVSKSAVVRNLMRRRVQAALRDFPLPAGDLVIRLYPAITTLNFSQISTTLESCLKRLR